MNKFKKIILATVLFVMAFSRSSFSQYVNGDYGSVVSGDWGTVSTWMTYFGGSFSVPAGTQPGAGDNVFILAGTTVRIDAAGKNCINLTVENTAQLYTNQVATNFYITVSGDIVCDGIIGNGITYDYLTFYMGGTNQTISGTGIFDAAGIQKNNASVATTNLTFNRNVNLRIAGAAIYNNDNATTSFNVTVSSGDTLTCVSGNAAIDGPAGAGASATKGTFTINGVMDVRGILYLATTNTSGADSCKWVVNGELKANQVNGTPTSAARTILHVNNGGKLNLTGNNAFFSIGAGNTYNFYDGSTVEYSSSGNQSVRVVADFGGATINQYSNLLISGTGTKSTTGLLAARNNITITDDTTTVGSPVLNPGANNIQLGGNWTNYNQSGFTEGTGVRMVTLNGVTNQRITCPGGEIFNILTLNNSVAGDSIILNDDITVDSTLNFQTAGLTPLFLNGHQLTLLRPNPAAITIFSSPPGFVHRFIVSETAVGNALYATNPSIIKWRMGTGAASYIFPFGIDSAGTASGTKIPVTISKKATATTVDVSVSTRATLTSNNRPWEDSTYVPAVSSMTSLFVSPYPGAAEDSAVIDRWWNIVPSTPFLAVDTIKFTYRGAENTLSVPYRTGTVYPQNWDGTNWTGQLGPLVNGVTGGVLGTVITVNDTIRFAPWVIVSFDHKLPISLLEFTARFNTNKVDVKWSTASETNNHFFTVERSKDAKIFERVGEDVPGAGTSSETHFYGLTDSHPLTGLSYYRLRQTDFDGRFTFSETVPVLNKDKNAKWYLFPNPATDAVHIASTDSEFKEATFQLLNAEGSLIRSMSINAKNQSIISIDISDLSKGIYIGKITDDYNQEVFKIVKN